MPADIWLISAAIVVLVIVIVVGAGYLLWWYAGRIDALRQIEDGRCRPMLREMRKQAAQAAIEHNAAAHRFLEWNRLQQNPPVRIGAEYRVFDAAIQAIRGGKADPWPKGEKRRER